MLDKDMVRRVLGWQHGKFAGVKVLTKGGNERYILGLVDGTSCSSGYIKVGVTGTRKRFDLNRVLAMMSENGHTFVMGAEFSKKKWLEVNKFIKMGIELTEAT